MGKYVGGRAGGTGRGKDKSVNKDEMAEYKSRVEVGAQGTDGDEEAEFMRHIEDVSEVAGLDQRWVSSWKGSLQARCASALWSFISINFKSLGAAAISNLYAFLSTPKPPSVVQHAPTSLSNLNKKPNQYDIKSSSWQLTISPLLL